MFRSVALSFVRRSVPVRCMCQAAPSQKQETKLLGNTYPIDKWTNISSSIMKKIGTNLHINKQNPIGLIKLQIQQHFYKKFVKRGNPLFSVYDNLSPVVTLKQNYDNLLVPKNHGSRKPSDSYYLNSSHMLRAHTTAHQIDLIKSGLDHFLIVGDVYRRDEIDRSHYPVFHQLDGVRLFTRHELFQNSKGGDSFEIFEENSYETQNKQACHTLESALMVEHDLKTTLEELSLNLFGKDTETRWVDAYFPFTHPSWELEIKYQDEWLEVLGCGVIQHEILQKAGAGDKIGWAFGMGLERLAMKLYDIPDIRLFWSQDSGFLSQFKDKDPNTCIKYKPISMFPQCYNDISFWIPESYHENDFYDLVRGIGEELVEQVELIDTFYHPKKQRTSHCYRLTYRHMEKTLTQDEVNILHKKIECDAEEFLGVELRN